MRTTSSFQTFPNVFGGGANAFSRYESGKTKPPVAQVAFFERNQNSSLPYTERMKRAIDSSRGRKLYGRRIAIVEPVFANLRHNKRLDRFTLRTLPKVNTQWNLYCLVHNIEKLAHHGYGT